MASGWCGNIKARNFQTCVLDAERRGVHMSIAECKNQIIEMVKQMQEESELRRLYLILVVTKGETE